MNCDGQYLLFYPYINHPISNEKPDLKKKYICLLEHFRNKFANGDMLATSRISQLKKLLLQDSDAGEIDIRQAQKDIMKSRFVPFQIFSYRYVFLFDAVFLLAPTDENLAQKISQEIKFSVHQRYHKKIDLIVQQMFMCPPFYPGQLVSQELFQGWVDSKAFLAAKEKHIVLTATMSAGKSTLVNAMIGKRLSFTKEAACTATTIEFISTPVYYPWYHLLSSDGLKPNLLPEEIRSATQGQNQPCTIIGTVLSEFGRERVRLTDTPGVDSSQNPAHKKITREVLKNEKNDVLIYVIPVSNYGSNADDIHLKYIYEKVSYQKILFVINMMDTCDFEDDSLEEILGNIAEHLQSIGFEAPILCPISAKAGLLFKLALSGDELSKNNKDALAVFCTKFQQQEYDLSGCYEVPSPGYMSFRNCTMSEDEHTKLAELYLRTGLPGFEAKLLQILQEV